MHNIQKTLSALIGVDSTSSLSNKAISDCIGACFENGSIQCHVLPSSEEGKTNIVALKGDPRDDGSGITLCGHMDTVPADVKHWESDPWELTMRDDRLYARGACDMKGFLAIAINAIQTIDVTKAPLAVLITCDEEIGSFGARHIVEHGLPIPIPKQVIIGEPTSLQVVRLHKGHLSLQVDIEGVSAHTGLPHLGKNAAVDGAHVIEALHSLGNTFAEERTDESKHFPEEAAFPVLTVATVHSGSAINVVPDRCTLGLGLRLLPDQDQEEIIEIIKQTIDSACSLQWSLTMLGDNPTMLTHESAPVNQWLCKHIGQEHSVGVSFGTDGGYLSRAGYECVLFGPGDIGVAHKPDEFVPMGELEDCAKTIECAITHFCGDI